MNPVQDGAAEAVQAGVDVVAPRVLGGLLHKGAHQARLVVCHHAVLGKVHHPGDEQRAL